MFGACDHTWPEIDSWHEGSPGYLYGYYTAGAWPKNEPGMVCVQIV